MIAVGSECYNVDVNGSVFARGVCLTTEELTDALNGCISEIIRDDAGLDEVEDLLVGLNDTDFAPDGIRDALSTDRQPEDWRVGEAIAEAYLTSHRSCTFPWPVTRDEKDPASSMPGTDLVGFQDTGESSVHKRFAFSEVKTSAHQEYPPSLMYGRHGLKMQLEDLRDREPVRKSLVLYLAHRAKGRDWEEHYKSAFIRYMTDTCDVAVLGVLIRDVEPNLADLRARSEGLSHGRPAAMVVELHAIYLPKDSISGLGRRVHLRREDDHASN